MQENPHREPYDRAEHHLELLRPRLERYFRQYGRRCDVDDMMAMLALRLWQSFGNLERIPLSWDAYIWQCARSISSQVIRRASKLVSISIDDVCEQADFEVPEVFSEHSAADVVRVANTLWLEVNHPGKLDEQAKVGLAILDSLGDREPLDHWHQFGQQLRSAAFHLCLLRGRDMYGILCRSTESAPLSSETTTSYLRDRFLYGLSSQRAAHRNLIDDHMAQHLEHWSNEVLSWPARFGRIHDYVTPCQGLAAWMATPPIWKRIAFEYSYLNGLSRQDVFERTAPIARIFGYSLSFGTVNMWLSGARLANELRVALVSGTAEVP